jgi:hypothetical protein
VKYAVVYYWPGDRDPRSLVVDAGTVRFMPDGWQVEAWYETKGEAESALAASEAK